VPDTTNLIKVSGNSILNTTVFPDTKLQTLDRRVGKDQLYFDRKLFEVTVDDWRGTPIIYQKDGIHPTDFEAVARDPIAAAEAIDGKYVGTVSNPRIIVPGGARLMAELDIDENEEEIVRLWQEGRLFPSTAFMANSDGDRLTSPPIPNHVLLFPVKVDEVLPGDLGAFVNTLEVQSMKDEKTKKKTCNAELPTEEKKPEEMVPEVVTAEVDAVQESVAEVAEEVAEKQTELDEIKAELELLKQEIAGIKAQEQPAEAVVNSEEVTEEEAAADVAQGMDDAIKMNEELIEHLKAENEALKAGIAALEEKIAGMEAASAEAEFNSIVEKLPAGMKATPEQIEALHTQYIAGDMKAMLHSVLSANVASGATQKVGQPFTQSNKVQPEHIGPGDLNKPRNHN